MKKIVGLLAALTAASATLASGQVTVSDPWVRAMPPTQRMTAGYATLHNMGNEAVTIVGASSTIAGVAELHTTVTSGDSRRMVPLEPVTIVAGDSFEFMPGGPHVMLMNVSAMPAAGSEVTLCFNTAQGEAICTEAPVSRGAPGGMDHSHHH